MKSNDDDININIIDFNKHIHQVEKTEKIKSIFINIVISEFSFIIGASVGIAQIYNNGFHLTSFITNASPLSQGLMLGSLIYATLLFLYSIIQLSAIFIKEYKSEINNIFKIKKDEIPFIPLSKANDSIDSTDSIDSNELN